MANIYNINYVLTEDEVYRALEESGTTKTSGKRRIVELVLLAVFSVYFLVSFFLTPNDYFNLVMGLVCLVFAVVVLIVPKRVLRNNAKKQADGKEVRLRVSEKKITVANGEKDWSIPLDLTSSYRIIDEKIILVIMPDKNLVVIPVRALPRENTFAIQSLLYQGLSEAKK